MMLTQVSILLGGIGLFLLGMALMTDGLKALAGSRLRDHLSRLEHSPLKAAGSGAAITAIVQSSSATTLATIGFVSAGLLPFQSSIWVIVGANIGTTSTGWLVALLGLKFSISKIAMPIVGLGALMRTLGRDRLSHLGSTLAGFGMIFIGIDFLQAGMAELAQTIDPADYASSGMGGRFILVGIGLIMTVIMQSSSAAVATTLTALAGGAITLDQAAALVIGQNIGTTVTAVLGSIGNSVAAKRTAAIHVIFNLQTGLVAIVLLPLFTGLIATLIRAVAPDDPALTIAAFHTAFNLVGALLFWPMARPLSRQVQKRIRGKHSSLANHLNRAVRDVPALAVSSAETALRECLNRDLWLFSSRLDKSDGPQSHPPAGLLEELKEVLPQISVFLNKTPNEGANQEIRQRQHELLLCCEHLAELNNYLSAEALPEAEVLRARERGYADLLDTSVQQLEQIREQSHRAESDLAKAMKRLRRQWQQRLVLPDEAAAKRLSLDERMRLVRLQHQIAQALYHLWRALKHLEIESTTRQTPPPQSPDATEG